MSMIFTWILMFGNSITLGKERGERAREKLLLIRSVDWAEPSLSFLKSCLRKKMRQRGQGRGLLGDPGLVSMSLNVCVAPRALAASENQLNSTRVCIEPMIAAREHPGFTEFPGSDYQWPSQSPLTTSQDSPLPLQLPSLPVGSCKGTGNPELGIQP